MARLEMAGPAPMTPVRAWLALTRVPFMSVALLPFILGMIMAGRDGHAARGEVVLASALAVFGVMTATHWVGEYFDYAGDAANQTYNRFSGGSRVLIQGLIHPRHALAGGMVVTAVVAALGLYIARHPSVGPLALPLGAAGLLAGVGYSAVPFRWAYRGIGEVIIGIIFGWLTINTGYYLLAGGFSLHGLVAAVPVGLSVFNIILINEIPDVDADRAVGKKTLVVRYGPEAAAGLYVGVAALIAVMLPLTSVVAGRPAMTAAAAPAIILMALNARAATGGAWRDAAALEGLCGRTVLASVLTAVGLGLGFGLL